MLTMRLLETLDMVNRMQFPDSAELADRLECAITTSRKRLLDLYGIAMIDRRMELDANERGFKYRYFITQKGELLLNEYRRHAREIERIEGL